MSKTIPAHERLICALDVPDADAARALVTQLGDAVGFRLLHGLLEDDGRFVREQGRVDLVRM